MLRKAGSLALLGRLCLHDGRLRKIPLENSFPPQHWWLSNCWFSLVPIGGFRDGNGGSQGTFIKEVPELFACFRNPSQKFHTFSILSFFRIIVLQAFQ